MASNTNYQLLERQSWDHFPGISTPTHTSNMWPLISHTMAQWGNGLQRIHTLIPVTAITNGLIHTLAHVTPHDSHDDWGVNNSQDHLQRGQNYNGWITWNSPSVFGAEEASQIRSEMSSNILKHIQAFRTKMIWMTKNLHRHTTRRLWLMLHLESWTSLKISFTHCLVMFKYSKFFGLVKALRNTRLLVTLNLNGEKWSYQVCETLTLQGSFSSMSHTVHLVVIYETQKNSFLTEAIFDTLWMKTGWISLDY